MEISLLSLDSIRIKGKSSSIVVNPQNKTVALQAAILIGTQQGKAFISDEGITIDGPGEYEIGGIKISGTRIKDETVYSMTVDGVAVAIGTLTALSGAQQKIKEHNIVIALSLSDMEASFITSIAVNGVLFYGPHAKSVVSAFAKEGVKTQPKYQATLEKLPQEMETVLLQ